MKGSTLTRREFFHDVTERTRVALPEDLRGFQTSSTMNLLKLYYGRYRLHYEVWADARDNQIEIGLHFEDGPESTERLIAYFDRYIVEIKHELGTDVELERWTNAWGHLFQLLPYQPLTDALVSDVAARLSRMIALLQPLLVEADARARIDQASDDQSLRLSARREGRWHRERRGARAHA